DVPYPADYGGAIDMFYRIVALYDEGIKIHLHYFSYNHHGNPNELNQYCESIHVYERKTGHKSFSFDLPYIVSSRINKELIERLNDDEHPVLLEGIHCSGILKYLNAEKRKIIVRLHNDENNYYQQLAIAELNLLKKLYFWNESRLLDKYQNELPRNNIYACISESDVKTFRDKYHLKQTIYLPAFVPYQQVNCLEGMGSFCLYHGNLSVSENEKAATWILQNVFSKINKPLVIAGKNPSKRLQKLVQLYDHTCLVADPSTQEMNDLVQKAHINLLPSFNTTGIKLKLLHAVFTGRHCVVNDAMVNGTGLEAACHVGINANALASIITQLHNQPFNEEEILLRKNLLKNNYNNSTNSRQLIALIL
ncbi:MAG: glycosyltransferase, partial [Bacteroidota bacterium]|nr:glycosyltransferase [Bacteroidota bacterium]